MSREGFWKRKVISRCIINRWTYQRKKKKKGRERDYSNRWASFNFKCGLLS